MHQYEIRILHADKTTDIVIEGAHLSDLAAVRAAKRIAEERPFEVWRDLDCVYRRKGNRAALNPSSPPAA
jgi:hypothetical protein